MALPQNENVFKGHLSKLEQKEGDGEETYKGRQVYFKRSRIEQIATEY